MFVVYSADTLLSMGLVIQGLKKIRDRWDKMKCITLQQVLEFCDRIAFAFSTFHIYESLLKWVTLTSAVSKPAQSKLALSFSIPNEFAIFPNTVARKTPNNRIIGNGGQSIPTSKFSWHYVLRNQVPLRKKSTVTV